MPKTLRIQVSDEQYQAIKQAAKNSERTVPAQARVLLRWAVDKMQAGNRPANGQRSDDSGG